MQVERNTIEVECIGGSLDGKRIEIDAATQFYRVPDQDEAPEPEIEEYILVRNPRNPSEKVLLAKYLYDKMRNGGLAHV